MSQQNENKKLRERLLAFSFACADLFIEVDGNNAISFVFGAAKSMTGLDEKTLNGKGWLDLFAENEHERLIGIRQNTEDGKRCGPIITDLAGKGSKQAVLSAIKMPDSQSFYISLAYHTATMEQIISEKEGSAEFERTKTKEEGSAEFERTKTRKEEIPEFERTKTKEEPEPKFIKMNEGEGFDSVSNDESSDKSKDQSKDQSNDESGDESGDEKTIAENVMDRDNFALAARKTMEDAKAAGQDVDITMLDFAPTADDKHRMGDEAWGGLISSIEEVLLNTAIDGQTAAEITEGRYSVIHESSVNSEDLRQKIAELAREQDPSGEGIEVRRKTLNADLGTLSDKDAARALIYSMNEFERSGADMSINSFEESLKANMTNNMEKMKQFKSIIERLDFQLHFQPIVNLENLEATHYEILSRFENGNTQEWIMFGEDVGMAAEFDLAVCERAINYISFKGGQSRSKFSVNISGQSVGTPVFHQKLVEMLSQDEKLPSRMIFEITESSYITDLDTVNRFISELHNLHFEVALDDFGAGAASFEYLQKLDVDYVKIDGKYIRNIHESKKDRAMVKSLVQMCRDMDIKVVAEFVESEEHFHILKEMGVHYGQGYLFGKPTFRPEYGVNQSLLSG